MLAGDAHGLIHSGVLKKSPPEDQMKKRRSWRDRFFTLYKKTNGSIVLCYYRTTDKSKHGNEQLPKGIIDMATCLTVESGHTLKGFEKMFAFCIVTPRRSYFLLAKKENEMNEWVQKICESCGFAATNSISPDSLKAQLDNVHTFKHNSGSHDDLTNGGEYNDAFSEAPFVASPRNNHSKSAENIARLNANTVATIPREGSFFGLRMPQVATSPYETLGNGYDDDYGAERRNNDHQVEYVDNTYGKVGNFATSSTYSSRMAPSEHTNDRGGSDQTDYGDFNSYGSLDVYTGETSNRAALEDYADFNSPVEIQLADLSLPSSVDTRRVAAPAAIVGEPSTANVYVPEPEAANSTAYTTNHVTGSNRNSNNNRPNKFEHYLNLLPDKPVVDLSQAKSNDSLSSSKQSDNPPPVNRSVKPQMASSSSSLSSRRSSSEMGRKPTDLKFNKRPYNRHVNEMLASVPLSPVTSFSKKRDAIPTFFADGIAGMENPPSPSRISRESINSSNSGSDSETPPHTNGTMNGQIGNGAPPAGGFGGNVGASHNSHPPVLRASNSVPASTVQLMNGSNLSTINIKQSTASEINYTELAPDSPAFLNPPNQKGLASGTKYENLNAFNFPDVSNNNRQVSSASNTFVHPSIAAAKPTPHARCISVSNSTPENARRANFKSVNSSESSSMSFVGGGGIEYSLIDSHKTQLLTKMRQDRDRRMKEENRDQFFKGH